MLTNVSLVNKIEIMEKQNCRVGTSKAITNEEHFIAFLENQYQNFAEKATNMKYSGTKLGDFFEQKAQKLQKTLENVMK